MTITKWISLSKRKLLKCLNCKKVFGVQAYMNENILVKESLKKENLVCKHLVHFTGDSVELFGENLALFVLQFGLSAGECVSTGDLLCGCKL